MKIKAEAVHAVERAAFVAGNVIAAVAILLALLALLALAL